MANLIIVNRQLKGDVYVGNSKLNFQKGVCQISDTEKDLVEKLKSLGSLGYEVYTQAEFKAKFLSKDRQNSVENKEQNADSKPASEEQEVKPEVKANSEEE